MLRFARNRYGFRKPAGQILACPEEVAFNDVQRSAQYPGGVALRFARIEGYRPDKRAEEADTIEAVRAFG